MTMDIKRTSATLPSQLSNKQCYRDCILWAMPVGSHDPQPKRTHSM